MTIFSKIIAGEIPCYKIVEDEKFFSTKYLKHLNGTDVLEESNNEK